ncbi:hypothetical protein [Bacillus sp. 165]|uniref:hypothetical protein n=1 Tax=Bacillus sp. 165 TaxID=1529117 RepID=UPI001ADA096D|nr:hypothetical protein [Bacillus sp. 165]MBO9130630.1 hypothetical protein [Bacillus sp. 165]
MGRWISAVLSFLTGVAGLFYIFSALVTPEYNNPLEWDEFFVILRIAAILMGPYILICAFFSKITSKTEHPHLFFFLLSFILLPIAYSFYFFKALSFIPALALSTDEANTIFSVLIIYFFILYAVFDSICKWIVGEKR